MSTLQCAFIGLQSLLAVKYGSRKVYTSVVFHEICSQASEAMYGRHTAVGFTLRDEIYNYAASFHHFQSKSGCMGK